MNRLNPLHLAVLSGNLEIVEYLIINGSSINAKDRFVPLKKIISHLYIMQFTKGILKLLNFWLRMGPISWNI